MASMSPVSTKSLIAVVAGLVTAQLAVAHAIGSLLPVSRREPSPIEVTLSSPNGSVAKIVATITNVGATDLNLLAVGTILDDKLPVERLIVSDEHGAEVQFEGIHASIDYTALSPEHFRLVRAGSSITTVIDGAAVHSFARAGTYTFTATGQLLYAEAPATYLAGPAMPYLSNALLLHVDPRPATVASLLDGVPARVSGSGSDGAPLEERTTIQAGCNATELPIAQAAVTDCRRLAEAAIADASDSNSRRFAEYFRTDMAAARTTVINRLTAVAAECAAMDAGKTRLFCYDYYGLCQQSDGPLVSYTLWSADTMVMCPLWWARPAVPVECHHQDRASTVVHEMTHCESVYSPHTNDYAYSYPNITQLPPDRALQNADTYSLYASAVFLNCTVDSQPE